VKVSLFQILVLAAFTLVIFHYNYEAHVSHMKRLSN